MTKISVSATTNEDETCLPVSWVSQSEHLISALDRSTDAAIWDRPLPLAVAHWLNGLEPTKLPEGRFVLEPNLVAECLLALFRARGIEDCPALQWFIEDAATLAMQISTWFDAEVLRLRLEPVSDNACSKLHIDNVVARLICTYHGPGTELGTDTAAVSSLTGVPTGMPILLKGKKWPSDLAPCLRHRSPQIEGTGVTRLMLVLEAWTEADRVPGHDRNYLSGMNVC